MVVVGQAYRLSNEMSRTKDSFTKRMRQKRENEHPSDKITRSQHLYATPNATPNSGNAIIAVFKSRPSRHHCGGGFHGALAFPSRLDHRR